MGFFTSRKPQDSDEFISYPSPAQSPDKSVVQVIRSRFYGKSKGKERQTFVATDATAAQTLSHSPPTPSPLKTYPSTSSILRSSTNTNNNNYDRDRPLPSTPAKKKASFDLPPPPPASASSSRIRTETPQTPLRDKSSAASISGSSLSPRKPTDTVTVTLAQRLNELAQANSDGLLNDDEYRMLRQNLFERFSSTTSVPTESPVVPAARPRPRKSGASETRPTSQSVSNFQVELPRPSSIHSSRNSIASNVTDIFRRATGRRSTSTSYDPSETSSVWSGASNNTSTNHKFKFPRVLSKKSSNSSVRTTRSQADAVSITSRAAGSEREPFSGARSATGSIRRAVPPSSFRAVGGDNKYAHSIANIYDEDNLKTSADIKQEISSVEAEARSLMDAFNGLELTALTKIQRRYNGPGRPSPRTPDTAKSHASFLEMADTRSGRRIQLSTDGDAGSIRSATSTGARSAYSANRRTVRAKTSLNASLALNSRPNSLHRKNSSSSVTSDRRAGGHVPRNSIAPPVPALPSSLGHLGVGIGNNSSVSLARSGHVPMSSVPEDGTEVEAGGDELEEDYEAEMEDIRQRREEVRHRYEARLEYLRAKLKGAQLHEKLMKK